LRAHLGVTTALSLLDGDMLAHRSTSLCLGMPRIVYVSWPATEISGGIKAAFQHVEILTEAGLDAAIASRDSSAPGWFKTDAKLRAAQTAQ